MDGGWEFFGSCGDGNVRFWDCLEEGDVIGMEKGRAIFV